MRTGKYVKCEICGKVIYKQPSYLERVKTHYCSRKCFFKSNFIKNRVSYKSIMLKLKDRKCEKNPNWRGDKTKAHSLHSWIRDNFKHENKCEICGTSKAIIFDWSNKDHLYSRIRSDWQYLCRRCHMVYDYKINNRKLCSYCKVKK